MDLSISDDTLTPDKLNAIEKRLLAERDRRLRENMLADFGRRAGVAIRIPVTRHATLLWLGSNVRI